MLAILIASTFAFGPPRIPIPLTSSEKSIESNDTTSAVSDPSESRTPTNPLNAWQDGVADLVDRVTPSVVAVEAGRTPANVHHSAGAGTAWISYGSGTILDRDGRILTSEHVVGEAATIFVILHDGRRFPARPIAADRRSDMAIVQIDASDLIPAPVGDADLLRRGHFLLTAGNPLGLANDGHTAVSHGTVSALGRPLPDEFGRDEDRYFGEMILTTILAGPGNSGGPLFNANGEIVGIVTAVYSRAGDAPPFTFATPLNGRNREILQQLMAAQTIEYGYLGVEVEEISESERAASGLHKRIGIRVASVFASGPADVAGVTTGDIVLTVDGHTVSSVDQFIRMVGAGAVGENVTLDVLRDKREYRLVATLTRRPSSTETDVPMTEFEFRGATIGHVSPAMRSMSNLPESALLVIRVQVGSPAAKANLSPGDIIIRANGMPLDAQADVRLLSLRDDVILGLANGATCVVRPQTNR